jgi:hypothetical protein
LRSTLFPLSNAFAEGSPVTQTLPRRPYRIVAAIAAALIGLVILSACGTTTKSSNFAGTDESFGFTATISDTRAKTDQWNNQTIIVTVKDLKNIHGPARNWFIGQPTYSLYNDYYGANNVYQAPGKAMIDNRPTVPSYLPADQVVEVSGKLHADNRRSAIDSNASGFGTKRIADRPVFDMIKTVDDDR